MAGAAGEIRWLADLPRAVHLWLGDKLVRWSRADRPVEYDPVADRFTAADVAPMHRDPEQAVRPRVDVTGRFDWPSGTRSHAS